MSCEFVENKLNKNMLEKIIDANMIDTSKRPQWEHIVATYQGTIGRIECGDITKNLMPKLDYLLSYKVDIATLDTIELTVTVYDTQETIKPYLTLTYYSKNDFYKDWEFKQDVFPMFE